MALFPSLPVESCVFSHEIPPSAFVEGRPRPETTEVLPPVVEAFAANNAEPIGRHLVGFLGAVWAAQTGVPVLGFEQLSTILTAAGSDPA